MSTKTLISVIVQVDEGTGTAVSVTMPLGGIPTELEAAQTNGLSVTWKNPRLELQRHAFKAAMHVCPTGQLNVVHGRGGVGAGASVVEATGADDTGAAVSAAGASTSVQFVPWIELGES